MRTLLRKSFWYGTGHAMDVIPLNRWYGWLGLLAALVGFPFALFVHYYFDPVQQLVLGFRPLKTLSTYAGLCGYVYGWYRVIPGTTAIYQKTQREKLENAKVQIR